MQPITTPDARSAPTWSELPALPRVYVGIVCVIGFVAVAWSLPAVVQIDAALLAGLLLLSIPISLVKVTLPGTASTLSLSHVLGYLALFALGPRSAVLVTAAGAWSQCRFRTRQTSPTHKMLFSIATLALAMHTSGTVFEAMGGRPGTWDTSSALQAFAASISVFFALNTTLVAIAISVTTRQRLGRLWCDTFLPTWPAYLLGAAVSAGSLFAIHHTGGWLVFFLTVPLAVAFYNLRLYLQRVDEASTDPLTALPNHRFAVAHAMHALASAMRERTRMTVVLGDLDGLKRVNDTYGHGAGDIALRAVARTLRDVLRDGDVCARYGGDEFLAVLTDCGPGQAAAIMRRAQAAIEALEIEVRPGVSVRVGLSIGAATCPDDHESLDRLLETADTRMYQNKLQRSMDRSAASGAVSA